MTIRASGPGHMPWRENNFKRLSANLYRTFIKETDSVLNSSNTTDNQNNASLSASQVSEEVQTFTVKTHVNKAQCFLYIDKRIMTIRASGPGHMPWRENNFKRLSANLYRTFIKETDSVLNSSNTTDNQNNASLSASQVSTQPNQSGGNYSTCTIEETQVQPSAVLVAEQPGQVDPATSLQVTPVIHHITTLMDMIHKLQRQISILT